MTQSFFLADGKAAKVVVTRILRFTRNGQGLAVGAHVAGVETDDPRPGVADRLRLAYGGPGDVPIVIRLDAVMAVSRIESLDAVWQDFRRRQTALDGAMAKDGQSNARALAIGRMLDAMSEADRVAMLSAFVKPVLGHCGTRFPADAHKAADGAIVTEIRADSVESGDLSEYHIDARTGLMQSLDRLVTTSAAPLRPLRERWVLEPAS